MNENTKLITVEKKERMAFQTDSIYQYDDGHVLDFVGFDELPEVFEVHFACCKNGDSITQVGRNGQVTLPAQFTQNASMIYAWLYISEAESRLTKYYIEIPVQPRARITDLIPTPTEQSAIDQAISALNDGVGRAETAATNAGTARDEAVSAKDNAEAAKRSAEESASSASRSAEVATEKKQAAEQAAQTATEKAQEATNAAQSASNSANAAAQSASDSVTHDRNAEAWAVGERNGQPVPESDVTYHNNAKYYSANADQKASAAGQSASSASASAQTAIEKANQAGQAAQTATEKANAASQSAASAAQDKTASAQNADRAQQAAQTATAKATQASEAAQTATQKAQEAGTSAANARESAISAGRYKLAIENIMPEAETRPPNTPATVSRVYDQDNNLIKIIFGLPQGEKGENGIYVGTTPPDDPNVAVWMNPEGTPLNLDSKQNAPAEAGTAGQVLGLDNQLNPVWIDNVATNDIPVEKGTGVGSVKTKSFTAGNTTYTNVASGQGSFAEGANTKATGSNSHAEGAGTQASGTSSHVEGVSTIARNASSHAEGISSIAGGSASHAEGNGSQALGVNSHAEGQGTQAMSTDTHAEGCLTIASGVYSHAEGNKTVARGGTSHVEGQRTFSIGVLSHTEGEANFNNARSAHVQGAGNELPSSQGYAFIHGTYSDAPDLEGDSIQVQPKDEDGNNDGPYTARTRGLYSEIVGNGTSDSNRSNAYALDWSGNGKYAGDVYVHSNTDSTGGNKLATENYVDDAVSHISAMSMHICSSQEYDSNTGVPTVANPDGSTFYLVPGGDSPNLYIEWVYINNAWEQFGSATIDIPVRDVQVNGTSVLNNGVANVPIADNSNPGVVKVSTNSDTYGIGIYSVQNPLLIIKPALSSQIKAANVAYRPIVPPNQHESAFYGLAKAAGDLTQSASSNAVGTYTDEAKAAIKTMLGIEEGLKVVRLI